MKYYSETLNKLFDTEENGIVLDGAYKDIVEAKAENIIVVNNEGKYGVLNNEAGLVKEAFKLKTLFLCVYSCHCLLIGYTVSLKNSLKADFFGGSYNYYFIAKVLAIAV